MIFGKLSKFFSKPYIPYFYVTLADHCNLNCKYCDHFSPLAEKRFIDIKKLRKDLKRFSSLVSIGNVGLMGGEPLLHPEIVQILNMTRQVLSKTHLAVFTNAILLPQMQDIFWQTCRDKNINILISRYPVKIDLKTIFAKAKQFKVHVNFTHSGLYNFVNMHKLALDLEGGGNEGEMSRICWQNKGSCSNLYDGKFYQCSTLGNIHRLSNYFNLNLYPSQEDYIDIYKAKSGKEIIEYTKKSLPFCKHCNIKNEKSNLDFEISKKELSEWT